MAIRRARRTGRPQTLLPLSAGHVSNSLYCWYCDWKIYIFNEPLFSIGRRYARFLRLWFAMGVAFGFIALFGVTMWLIWVSAGALHFHKGTSGLNSLSVSWLFGTSPLAFGSSISIRDAGTMVFSTLISVSIHEFGHAIAATSEGIQVEYIAIFLAIIFPGALVAFNYDLLQSLPQFPALRIYCAGIWHNLVFCAVCRFALFLLPLILFPLYIHGDMPMVLEVPQTSPLTGYLSRGDVIMSVDGSIINYPHEWTGKMVQINDHVHYKGPGRKGYCVPISWLKGTNYTVAVDDRFSCPDELAAFVNISCTNSSSVVQISNEYNEESRRENKHCLTAKDVVKLKKCGDGWQMTGTSGNNCACEEEEFCMAPEQVPGTSWVEISYSSPHSSECLQFRENTSVDSWSPVNGSTPCGATFVFVGDVLALAYGVQLSAYRPRWAYIGVTVPSILENILSCTLHVSATLAFVNSFPVFFLDGESILEIFLCFFTWSSPRRRQKVLRFCLIGGCILSIIVFSRILYLTAFVVQP